DDTVLAGYTSKNKLVNFKAPKEMVGKLVDVKIDEAKQYSLNGTFIGEHQRELVMQ
ncbi:MAG: TRAM domain-containing protein, partial [Staphylococcus warneri]|nr:TRAM domain-containing protein [Staphylococcus warneri]